MVIAEKVKERTRREPKWVVGGLLLLHLVVISLNRAPQRPDLRVFQAVLLFLASPLQSGVTQSLGWVTETARGYVDLRGVRQENLRLKGERAQLESQLTLLREQINTLSHLKGLVDWQQDHPYPMIPARVVGRDANHLFQTVIINRGSRHGVEKDQPVVDGEGLVGRVIVVSPISARVLLVTDERHGAGAIIGTTLDERHLGIVRGDERTPASRFDFLTTPQPVPDGQAVVTSGQDGIYPPGLLIGRILHREGEGTTAQPRLTLLPAAALGRLEVVSVLQVTREQIRGAIDPLQVEEKGVGGSSRRRR
jgi:rod shape-determining protein MreC